MRRSFLTLAILVLAVGMGACGDDGPKGPGAIDLEVRSSLPSVGAVIVELTGPGIQGVEGRGATLAYGGGVVGQSQGGTLSYRVVLVNEVPGTLHFAVQVADLAEGAPAAVVIGAVDGDNELLSLESFSVTVSR